MQLSERNWKINKSKREPVIQCNWVSDTFTWFTLHCDPNEMKVLMTLTTTRNSTNSPATTCYAEWACKWTSVTLSTQKQQDDGQDDGEEDVRDEKIINVLPFESALEKRTLGWQSCSLLATVPRLANFLSTHQVKCPSQANHLQNATRRSESTCPSIALALALAHCILSCSLIQPPVSSSLIQPHPFPSAVLTITLASYTYTFACESAGHGMNHPNLK